MPEKLGLATGLSKGLAFFEDVYMARLRKKLEDQMAEKNASRKHFMDQADAVDEADRKKADAADVNKQTETANKATLDRQKAAFDADVDSDVSLDPAVKSRAKTLAALGTSEGLARAESMVKEHRTAANKPKNHADEFKQQITDLGGWKKARETNPDLVAKAEVYGVTPPKEEKPEKIPDRDKPPSAQEMIDAALAHVKGQKASAQAIEAKLIGDRVPAEKAHAIALRIAEMDPDERKASIKFLESMYRKKNPAVADSLIADWSQPGDFADTTSLNMTGIGTSTRPKTQDEWDNLPAIPETGYAQPPLSKATSTPAGAASDPNAKPAPNLGRDQTGIPGKSGISVVTGQPAPAGEVSKDREMSLYDKERELDLILQKLREELAQ